MKAKRLCLVSVTDKEGLYRLCPLVEAGWEFLSTGGTAKVLRELGIPVIEVSDYTGFPEMLDGRVKTLHPKIAGGILADRDKPEHMAKLAEFNIRPIDLVIVNLYAFEKDPGIENIDVGGPSALRAGAKNCKHVTVVCDPDDYETVVNSIISNGTVSQDQREVLAQKVFELTGSYDEDIRSWMKWLRKLRKSFLGANPFAKTAAHH